MMGHMVGMREAKAMLGVSSRTVTSGEVVY